MVLPSVAASPWARSADDGTSVSQCPLKDGQAGPHSCSERTPGLATMGSNCTQSASEARDSTKHTSIEEISQSVTMAAPCSRLTQVRAVLQGSA